MQLGLAAEIRLYQRQKGAQFKKLYLVVSERGVPVKFIVTDGTRADCKEAINLLKNLDAKLVFADRVYDTNEILSYIARRNIKSKRNRLERRDYKGFRVLRKRDSSLTENFIALDILSKILFLLLNIGAVSPPRYAKTLDGFIASIYVRCIFVYLSFF